MNLQRLFPGFHISLALRMALRERSVECYGIAPHQAVGDLGSLKGRRQFEQKHNVYTNSLQGQGGLY